MIAKPHYRSFPALILLLALWIAGLAHAGTAPVTPWANRVILTDSHGDYPLGLQLAILEDPERTLTLDDVTKPTLNSRFIPSTRAVPGFGFKQSAYWARIDIERQSSREQGWMLEFGYAPMQWIDVYTIAADGRVTHQRGGSAVRFSERPYPHYKHVFELDLMRDKTTRLYVRVDGESSKNLSLRLYRADVFATATMRETAVLSIYAGVILGLVLYNLFVYVSIRERAYLFYIGFSTTFLMVMLSINGLTQPLLLPDSTTLAIRLIPTAIGLAILFAYLFTMDFLDSRRIMPRIHRIMLTGAGCGLLIAFLPWIANYRIAIIVGTAVSLLAPFTGIIAAIHAIRAGNHAARYYLMSWFILLSGIVLFSARSFGFLPSSLLTEYGMLWGSSAEAVLLSIALAARMKALKEEKEQAQRISMEQQSLVIEQQKHLIQHEKMAHLGLLSAGVAHEINNPNNFMKISAQTTEQKLRELQEFIVELMGDDADAEIEAAFRERFAFLLQQVALINEGSTRIAGIVSGMRAVSRQEDSRTVRFDPVQAMQTSLEIVKPSYKHLVDFDTTELTSLGQVEGYPSRLDQVFINLIVNACHAIEEKLSGEDPGRRGIVRLFSRLEGEDHLVLSVDDNGCGMTSDVQARLFQPFFTTKGQDKGTGLGLGICKGIITEHAGKMRVESEAGRGTRFDIILPLAPENPHPAPGVD